MRLLEKEHQDSEAEIKERVLTPDIYTGGQALVTYLQTLEREKGEFLSIEALTMGVEQYLDKTAKRHADGHNTWININPIGDEQTMDETCERAIKIVELASSQDPTTDMALRTLCNNAKDYGYETGWENGQLAGSKAGHQVGFISGTRSGLKAGAGVGLIVGTCLTVLTSMGINHFFPNNASDVTKPVKKAKQVEQVMQKAPVNPKHKP